MDPLSPAGVELWEKKQQFSAERCRMVCVRAEERDGGASRQRETQEQIPPTFSPGPTAPHTPPKIEAANIQDRMRDGENRSKALLLYPPHCFSSTGVAA